MELSVEKEMCQMSEQEDSLEKNFKNKKGIFCCVRNLGHTNIFRFQENVSG